MALLTRRRLLVLGGAALATGAYAWRVEPTWLEVTATNVTVPGLPGPFDGYRVVHLSDFHHGCGVPREFLVDAVERANAAEPDLVAITGDLLHHSGGGVAEISEILGALRAPDGVVVSFGNHDRGEVRALQAALASRGLRPLRNERFIVERSGDRLFVAGYGDLWNGWFQPNRFALRDAPTIALSHNPDTALELVGRGARLILAGHTHGGQVRLPWLGPIVLPVKNREFSAGLYDLQGAKLYVNRGIGWLNRVRLFTRPEVAVLTLRTPA